MESSVDAIPLGPPVADADAEAAGLDQVGDLRGTDDVGVVLDAENRSPALELGAKAKVGGSHADAHGVLAHRGWGAKDLDVLADEVEGLGNLRRIREAPQHARSGSGGSDVVHGAEGSISLLRATGSLIDGDQEPENVAEFLTGMIKGPQKDQ